MSRSGEVALRIAQWVAIAAVLVALMTPLIVADSMFFPYITGKNFAFRALVEVAAGAWLILAVARPYYRPPLSLPLVALMALLGWMAVADAFAVAPVKAFWSNFERMEGWVGFAHVVMWFVVVSGLARGERARGQSERFWWWLWHTSLAVATVVALLAVRDYLAYLDGSRLDPRVFATLGNATYLAVYALFHTFIAWWFLLRAQTGWARAGYALLIGLQLFAIYHTATRGAILGVLGGAVVAGGILLWEGAPHWRRAAIALCLSIVFVVGGFMLVRDAPWVRESPVLSRFASISLNEGTVAARLRIWKMAIAGITERPLVGWGHEGFSAVFDRYYDPAMYNQEQWFDRAHNVFLDWAIAGGVPALVLYLLLYASFLWYLWAPQHRSQWEAHERAVLTGLATAYSFNNLFVFDNLTSYLLFMLVLAWVVDRVRGHVAPRLPAMPRVVPLAAAVSVVIVGFFLSSTVIPGVRAAQALVSAVVGVESPMGGVPHPLSLSERVERLARADLSIGLGNQEVAEQAFQLVAQAVSSGEAREEREAFVKLVQFTNERFAREVARAPLSARLAFFYAAFFSLVGQSEKAQEWFERAIRLSPHKQSMLVTYASYLAQRGMGDEARQWAHRALALEPRNEEARAVAALVEAWYGSASTTLVLLREGGEQARLLFLRFTSLLPPQRREAVRSVFQRAGSPWREIAPLIASSSDHH